MYKTLQTCANPTILRNNIIYKCGKCDLCRLYKMQEWKVRGTHELITQKKAIYCTLTYKPSELPKAPPETFEQAKPRDAGGNLDPRDMTLFLKRLRKIYDKKGVKLRYLYCGEYGGETHRPHYHIIIYGLEYTPENKHNIKKAWGKGFVDIDKEKISPKCIQYVLGYVRKKIGDKDDEAYYKRTKRRPPFQRQSQGLGKQWAIDNLKNWVELGTVCVDNKQSPIPRYYVKTLYKLYGKTVKYTSTTKYLFADGGYVITKNPNNYKTIPNLDNEWTRKVTARRLYATHNTYNRFLDKYQDYSINKSYFFNLELQRAKYWIKNTRIANALFLQCHDETIPTYRNQNMRDIFSTFNIKNGAVDTAIFNRPTIDHDIIDNDTQSKMRNIATTMVYNLRSSPFGKRNGIDFESLDTFES